MEEAPSAVGEPADSEGVATLLETVAVLAVRHLSGNEISFTTASTLSRLARHGPQRLTRLALAESVAQPSMTQLVQRLDRQGLVRRVRDAADGRVVLVSITDAGRAVLRRRRETRRSRLEDLMGTLSADDRQALTAAARIAMPAVRRLTAGARRLESLSGDPPPV